MKILILILSIGFTFTASAKSCRSKGMYNGNVCADRYDASYSSHPKIVYIDASGGPSMRYVSYLDGLKISEGACMGEIGRGNIYIRDVICAKEASFKLVIDNEDAPGWMMQRQPRPVYGGELPVFPGGSHLAEMSYILDGKTESLDLVCWNTCVPKSLFAE